MAAGIAGHSDCSTSHQAVQHHNLYWSQQVTSRNSLQVRSYQLGLLYQSGTVLAHSLNHTHGCSAAEAGLGLAGDQEGIHEGLGMMLANAHKQVVDRAPHRLHRCVDSRYHLQHVSSCLCTWYMYTSTSRTYVRVCRGRV